MLTTAPPDVLAGLGRMSDDVRTGLMWQWVNYPERRDEVETAIRGPPTLTPSTPESRTASNNHKDPSQRVREKAAIRSLGRIPEYSGTRANDAARLWLRDCENYFEKLQRRSLEPIPDYEKIDSAESRLIKTAERHWRSHRMAASLGRTEGISTWPEFQNWVLELFGEHFSERKRWERFESLVQGRERVRDFAMKLDDAAALLEPEAPPQYVIRQKLLGGISRRLLGRWTEERQKPQGLQDTINRLAELEEGAIVRYSTDPDPMDLSAMDARPSNPQRKRGNGPSRYDHVAPIRKCFRCNSTAHLLRDCPKGPQEGDQKRSGKARGQ